MKIIKLNYDNKAIFLLLVLLGCLSFEALGQKYLLLDRIGSKRRIEFQVGNEFSFRMKGEDHFNTAIITHLQDSLILLDVGMVNINDIHSIKIGRESQGILGAASKVRAAGIVLVLIDQFNTVVVAGQPFSVNSGVFWVGGSIVALSLIMDLANRTKYRVGRKWRLKVIDLGFRPNQN